MMQHLIERAARFAVIAVSSCRPSPDHMDTQLDTGAPPSRVHPLGLLRMMGPHRRKLERVFGHATTAEESAFPIRMSFRIAWVRTCVAGPFCAISNLISKLTVYGGTSLPRVQRVLLVLLRRRRMLSRETWNEPAVSQSVPEVSTLQPALASFVANS